MPHVLAEQLSPSQIVLLRGEDFVHQRGNLILPNGAKVSMRSMAKKLTSVALLACAAEGLLSLQVHTQKTLFGLWTSRMLFAAPQESSIPWPRAALEARLAQLALQLQPEGRHRVQALIHVFLGKDSPDPWRQIVATVQGGLVASGALAYVEDRSWSLFHRGQQLRLAEPAGSLIDSLDVTIPQNLLAHYRQATPEIWRLLHKEITRGISHRRKRADPIREDYYLRFS